MSLCPGRGLPCVRVLRRISARCCAAFVYPMPRGRTRGPGGSARHYGRGVGILALLPTVPVRRRVIAFTAPQPERITST